MERRKEDRDTTAAQQGTIRLFNPLIFGSWSIRVTDQSSNGLGFTGPVPLSPGTLVQIRLPNRLVLGEVRYCIEDPEGGFSFGVRVESVMQLRAAA